MSTNQVMPFVFEDHSVRVVRVDGDLWFVAMDVAEALGYSDTDQAIRQHCKSAQTYPVNLTGQVRHVKIFPERDLYRLIMSSKLPSAERFTDWVVDKVLPSIRKHGGYIAGQEQETDPAVFLAKALKFAESVINDYAAKLEAAAPKIAFVDRYVTASSGSKGFREVARLIGANEREFRKFLTHNGILYRLGNEWTPHKKHITAKRFEIKAGIAGEHAFNQAKFTAKGVDWIAGEWAKFNLRAAL